MTFEEFFQKKKIDLAAFGGERPQLLEEFQKHFEAMGEKSFDHTKKYWFNKLRKSYPLKEEVLKAKSPAPQSNAEVSAGNASLQGGETPKSNLGFKPRFKAGKTSAASQQEKKEPEQDKEPEQSAENSKPAYKPRFRAGTTPRQKE